MNKAYFRELFATIVLVIAVWSPAYGADNAAPLGLVWGSSVDEVLEKYGPSLSH